MKVIFRNFLKDLFNNLFLATLSIAIALFPSIYENIIKRGAGESPLGFELRLEDFIILFFVLWGIVKFLISKKKGIKKPPLFTPILFWLGFGFLSVLVNWIFFGLGLPLGFFYLLKEVEFFFLFFIVFYLIKNIDSVKFILKLWILFAFIHISWIIFELVTGIRYSYYYGPIIYIEPVGPFPGAGFLLIIFAFLLNVYIFYYLSLKIPIVKKIIIGLITASLVLGIIVSKSSTSVFALFAIIFLSFLFYFIKTNNFKSKLLIAGSAVLTIIIVLLVLKPFYFIDQIRGATWEYSSEDSGSRISILKYHLNIFYNSSVLQIILGRGVQGDCHGQYIRILLERGLFGFALFFVLIGTALKRGFEQFLKSADSFLIGISAGFLAITFSMLIISIPADPFMMVKIAEVYWFFAGLSFAVFNLYKNKLNANIDHNETR
jgi:hypothetical protein